MWSPDAERLNKAQKLLLLKYLLCSVTVKFCRSLPANREVEWKFFSRRLSVLSGEGWGKRQMHKFVRSKTGHNFSITQLKGGKLQKKSAVQSTTVLVMRYEFLSHATMRSMSPEQTTLLSLLRLPGRLTADQTAWVLGFDSTAVPVLVAAKLLKPLGRPPATGHKYYATCEIERLRNDPEWLAKASDALVRHWKRKNESRSVPS
jgi:hypothetical protein